MRPSCRKALILLLLFTKLLSSLLHSGNILLHSILKEGRLVAMRSQLFRHTLGQEMGFFDSRTLGDIQSSMNPVVVIDAITWRIPYLVGNIFKILMIIFFLMQLNINLAVMSFVFMVVFRLILKPIDKKYEILTKIEEKIRTMMNQTQHESLSMITSVKLFSKENFHLTEQQSALDQLKDLMIQKNFFRFLVSFIGSSFHISSFCLALYFGVAFADSLNMNSGNINEEILNNQNRIFYRRLYSIFPSLFSNLDGVQLHL